MIVINNNVYSRFENGYVKCILHKKKVHGREVYFLEETSTKIRKLPEDYQVMTLSEIIAKYGNSAIDDNVLSSEGRSSLVREG